MQYDVRQIRVAAYASQIRATVQVARAGGAVAQVRILAERTVQALIAAINAPAIELGLQAQIIKAAAITGQFVEWIYANDQLGITDDKAFALQRHLSDIAGVAEQAVLLANKGLTDGFQFDDQAMVTATKGLADTLGFSDVLVMFMDRKLADQAAAQDLASIATSKPFADGFGWFEGPGRAEYAIDYFLEDYAYEGAPAIQFIKARSDAAAFTDSSVRTVGKGLNEPLQLSETIGFHISRHIADSINITDDLDGVASLEDDQVISLRKAVTDLAAVTDSFVRVVYFTRSPVDPVSFTDSSVSRVGKAAADGASATDAPQLRTSKPLADASTVSDSAARASSKPLADAFALTDAYAKSTNKGLSDSGFTTDSITAFIGKAASDTINNTDLAAIALTRPTTDSFAVTDSAAKSAGKSVADGASVTDSGAFRMQDYCDITYFAEDYVGIYFTF